jgi:hypothetical protein
MENADLNSSKDPSDPVCSKSVVDAMLPLSLTLLWTLYYDISCIPVTRYEHLSLRLLQAGSPSILEAKRISVLLYVFDQ